MSYENWSARGRTPGETETEVRDALDARRVRTRQDAAIALVDAADSGLDRSTIDALGERAVEDEDHEVRQFAVEALGVAGAAPAVVRQALDDPEAWVRAEAVVALSRVGGNAAELEGALDDDSGWVRRNAVIALGKRGEADQPLLVDCIKTDPHPAVREYAAQFLSSVAEDVSEAERILAAMLAREPNAFARAKAAESLGQLGTDRAEQALEAHGVTDQSEDVARTAKQALASARGTDPENLDVEIGPPSAPGSGPDTPAEQSVDGYDPAGSFSSTRAGSESPAPGGAPGFDPRRDLNTDPEDRT
ncbi:HEAT repeat domain-containing protein [Haloarcula sp. CBA1130]|uniref:HEAT repeat domain-containing protein n=1 Tax=unclassified Haloarcula TaxID=2624677 RepID=UPI00124646BB|nr:MULTISPECIES: HEAT repeat domain-containing protein [unclassified Haloarcula]KAA9396461.1 HEAT repeat domain-containing protein [Haloarcula sp. CBA1130]KAA9397683.1 HEAT repeat domain-containing protein [Haloarcula sp. CBA1129]